MCTPALKLSALLSRPSTVRSNAREAATDRIDTCDSCTTKKSSPDWENHTQRMTMVGVQPGEHNIHPILYMLCHNSLLRWMMIDVAVILILVVPLQSKTFPSLIRHVIKYKAIKCTVGCAFRSVLLFPAACMA